MSASRVGLSGVTKTLLLGLVLSIATTAWADRERKSERKSRSEDRDVEFRVASVSAQPVADSARITETKWKAEDRRLEVKARGDADSVSGRRVWVSVANADTDALIFSREVRRSRDGRWEMETKQQLPSSDVPCRIRLDAGNATAYADLEDAPANCVGGGGANQAPTANAGPDQTLNLSTGQTGIAVTLDGSGSSDPDGSLASYNWTGTPDPADVVGPTVTLGEGSHSFNLVVTDNDGASSAPDSVVLTVNPAVPGNLPPTAHANGPYTGTTGAMVSFSSAGSNDPDGSIASYAWSFGDGGSSSEADPSHVYAAAGSYKVSLTAIDNAGASASDATTATITATVGTCDPAASNLSINSTSEDGCPEQPVPEVEKVLNGGYRVLAINDLGMHCGDLDTRISSILPPFQVLLGQVIQRGATPMLNPAGVALEYSAASNSSDPATGPGQTFPGVKANGDTYKTNFWDVIAGGAYDPFYPSIVTPLLTGPFPVTEDVGLPVPNVEELYIGADGVVNSGDEQLTAVQHAMPGLTNPYFLNAPQAVKEHYGDKPFFVNFPFGYVAEGVNWYEGAGIPFAAYDDYGRENAYPLVRVEAKQGLAGNKPTVATVDTVLPISGEASCTNCHSAPADVQNSRTSQPTDTLTQAGLPVATSLDDPDSSLPNDVSVEYAADINIVRLLDLKHGTDYVDTSGAPAPCSIDTANPDGDANCLINKALVQGKAVVCQVCHYTPALDLAQVGPVAGPPGTDANGRNQVAHSSNSNVMHSHHGGLGNLFPPMPAPIQNTDGVITNQAERLTVLEETCYQCHPGTNVQCLRGAMFNGGMLCNDCHGDMQQVGNDFSAGVSPTSPGAFVLDQGNFYDPASNQPRVPWANEPGCGSCHTGDVRNNLVDSVDSIVNTRDQDGNVDLLRLRQAYRTGDPKATPIVPTNKRFAEPAVPAVFSQPGTDFANPGAGNPQLYRVSTGHGGVMCEGCHGATHAEWPNANPNANDNVTAKQLQGHVGTIVECSTCHTGDLGNTLDGPHGMHAVGANTRFADGGHEDVAENNPNACRACHGNNGQGSVLSRVAVDRDFRGLEDGGIVRKGEPVTCNQCHDNEL